MPPSRITLQRLKQSHRRGLVPDWDAQMTGVATDIPPPPSILLDYMYGAAAYQSWGRNGQDMTNMMDDRHADRYHDIPIYSYSSHSSQGENSPEPDDANGDDDSRTQNGGRNHRSHASDGLLRAMDGMARLAMLMKGTTSEAMAAERQKRADEAELRRHEAELHEREASRVKVELWKQSIQSGDRKRTGLRTHRCLPSGANSQVRRLSMSNGGTGKAVLVVERCKRDEAQELKNKCLGGCEL